MMHPQANEDRFLLAFRLHRSGIRFLGAGLYSDAIHTLIHGLEVLEFSRRMEDSYDVVARKYARWNHKDVSMKNAGMGRRIKMEINQKPMDHTCYTNEEWMTPLLKPCCSRCRGSLIGAMLYNMALAYHLQAMTFDKGCQQTFYSYLNQASSLYSAAEGIMQKYNIPIPSSLETNEQHVHWVICSRPVPDSSLLSLQSFASSSSPSPNMETAKFGSSILEKGQKMGTMICSVVQSTNSNTMEANFGSSMEADFGS